MLCKSLHKCSVAILILLLSACKISTDQVSVQGSLDDGRAQPQTNGDDTSDKYTYQNFAPVAVKDNYTTVEDQVLTVSVQNGVLKNDSDENNDAIFVKSHSQASNGAITIDRYGAVHYAPNASFEGTETVTYVVSDGYLEDQAEVVIVVTNAPNRAPVAQNDTYSVVENTQLTRNAAAGVLQNDSDPDNDAITVTNKTNPSHGTATVNANGSFTYTPTTNYSGPDSFTYTISDGALTDTATVNINVTDAPNQAPVAQNKNYSTNENTALVRNSSNGLLQGATDPNGDMISVSNNTNPAHGTLSVNANGSFTYTPTFGYSGNDSFNYTVTDGALTDTATVSITVVAAPNQAPTAIDKNYTANENTTLSVSSGNGLLNGAMDPDGDPITAILNSNPSHGSASVNANGSFSYTPTNGYSGSDSFTFRVSDGSLFVTKTAYITVVAAPNQAPNAQNKSYSLDQDTTLVRNASTGLLSGATDPDGDTLTVTSNSNPSHGSVSVNTDGSFTYTPTSGYYGSDSFTYTITDGALTDSATVSLTINQVGTIPTTAGCSNLDVTFPGVLGGKNTSARKMVSLCANVQASPARITLRWANVSGVTRNSVSVYRRVDGTTSWGSAIATPSASGNTFQDTNVSVGVRYNYKVQMSTSAGTAYGYIDSGIAVPASEYEGKVIVVVDSTFQSSLAADITKLVDDYHATGWIPIVRYVSRTASAQSVLEIIKTEYGSDPANVKAVFLLGHVPVPYSGTVSPDGHGDHSTGWAADGYYGDMNSTWGTSSSGTWAGAHGPNANSRFSPSTYPSAIELEVGRVDMYDLPAFSQSETSLLSDYLNRLHNFKNGTFVPQNKARIQDNLLWAHDGFARAGFSSIPTAVDPKEITVTYYGTSYFDATNNNSHLWGLAYGGGSTSSIDGHGTTNDLANKNMSGVFNMVFGSYFGDWDAQNNVLRAFLADSEGLTNTYSGGRQVYTHQMSMGKTAGFSMKESMNNSDSNFNPSYSGCCGGGSIYMALMGDPTLKLFYIKSPSNLAVSNNNGTFRFTWTASSGASSGSVDGYNIYKVTSSGMTKVNSSLISATATSYNSTMSVSNNSTFVIRPVRLQTTPSGTYWNMGLGSKDTY